MADGYGALTSGSKLGHPERERTVGDRLGGISESLGRSLGVMVSIMGRIETLPGSAEGNKVPTPSGINGWLMQIQGQAELLAQGLARIDSQL